MRSSKTVVWLSGLVAALALVAAGAGVFWPEGGSPFTFTSLHGREVQMYGRGLYRNDSLLIGAGYRGTDAVVLAVQVPLLVLATVLYRRGSLRGGLLLAGMLSYFLYYYASQALGTAYNSLFLVYVALFSASLFALLLAFASFDLESLPSRFSDHLPARGIALFLFTTGVLLLAAWLPPILGPLTRGQVPELVESYATVITWVLDLGVVVPVVFTAGVLLRRRAPMGYLLTSTLLVLCLTIGISLIAQGAAQLLAGVPLTTGEIVAFSLPFVFLTVLGVWPTASLFRHVLDQAPPRPAT